MSNLRHRSIDRQVERFFSARQATTTPIDPGHSPAAFI
jgi:hypothetical protein